MRPFVLVLALVGLCSMAAAQATVAQTVAGVPSGCSVQPVAPDGSDPTVAQSPPMTTLWTVVRASVLGRLGWIAPAPAWPTARGARTAQPAGRAAGRRALR